MLNTSALTIGAVTLAATTGVWIEATLATRYSTERTFEVSVAVESSNETLSSEFYIDGEPMEGRGFGGGGSSTSMSYSYTDTAKEVKGGAPTKVERSFDEVSASTEREGRDGPMEMEAESSFDGLTILITGEDGESEVEIVDGEEPEGEGRAARVSDEVLEGGAGASRERRRAGATSRARLGNGNICNTKRSRRRRKRII